MTAAERGAGRGPGSSAHPGRAHRNTEMLSLDGARLAYDEQGSGDPVVFVHGAATGSAVWGSVPAMLAELDPHPTGVLMHHVRAGDVAACPVPLTWLLAEDSGAWYEQLHADMQRRMPTLHTVRIERAGHSAVLDRPRAVADTVHEAAVA